MHLLLIEASLATNNNVTNCICLNCAAYAAHISKNKFPLVENILLCLKRFIESNVNTNNLLVLMLLFMRKYSAKN